MSSRVTNSIASRKAREALLRLLFPTTNNRPPSEKNATSYSYAELRAAYLAKVHAMHPDKLRSRRHNDKSNNNDAHDSQYEENDDSDDNIAHVKFIELKNAWEEYDGIMKQYVKVSHRRTVDNPSASEHDATATAGSFTMFGVGCSFADNPREREYRNEITEMACRGWIPSGSLSCGGEFGGVSLNFDGNGVAVSSPEESRLSDEDWFVVSDGSEIGVKTKEDDGAPPKSLVQDIDKFKKR